MASSAPTAAVSNTRLGKWELSVLAKVVLLALAVQVVSATFLVKDFDTPNFSTIIGRNLAATGEFWGGNPIRLKGPYAHGEQFRMFNLPGEALLLAGAFKTLPAPAWRYIHVPFAVLLIACATWVATLIGGESLGWMAGMIGIVSPFMILHGPVWDDLTFASALTWTGICLIWNRVREPEQPSKPAFVVLLGIMAAAAAMLRTEAQAEFGFLALAVIFIPRLKSARWEGIAVLAGIVVSLTAWGLRNQRVSGSFFLGSTHDGITLWESISPAATQDVLQQGHVETDLDAKEMEPDFRLTAPMTEVEANKYFTHRAVTYLLANPLAVAKLSVLKLAFDAIGVDFSPPVRKLRNFVSVGFNCALLVLAALGVITGYRRIRLAQPDRLFFYLVVGITVPCVIGLLAIGAVGLRYSMTLYPLIWLAAAVFLDSKIRGTQRGTRSTQMV